MWGMSRLKTCQRVKFFQVPNSFRWKVSRRSTREKHTRRQRRSAHEPAKCRCSTVGKYNVCCCNALRRWLTAIDVRSPVSIGPISLGQPAFPKQFQFCDEIAIRYRTREEMSQFKRSHDIAVVTTAPAGRIVQIGTLQMQYSLDL